MCLKGLLPAEHYACNIWLLLAGAEPGFERGHMSSLNFQKCFLFVVENLLDACLPTFNCKIRDNRNSVTKFQGKLQLCRCLKFFLNFRFRLDENGKEDDKYERNDWQLATPTYHYSRPPLRIISQKLINNTCHLREVVMSGMWRWLPIISLSTMPL